MKKSTFRVSFVEERVKPGELGALGYFELYRPAPAEMRQDASLINLHTVLVPQTDLCVRTGAQARCATRAHRTFGKTSIGV